MKIALYHGYELSGSGSNEYTRYLARTLAELGHTVVLACSEPDPAAFDFVTRALAHHSGGRVEELFARRRPGPGAVHLHRLPRATVHPVYVADKQRPGVVKTFPELSDAELVDYHLTMAGALRRILAAERPAIVHANHLIDQPVVAAAVCAELDTPFYVVPHGSAIEYSVKRDPRYRRAARDALLAARGIVWIAREVRERVLGLYPELAAELARKGRLVGVGTDTGLFRPQAPGARGAALAELAAAHVRGGKRAVQRQALRAALDRLDLEATRRDWDAYDHRLPDDDLPQLLERLPAEGALIGFVGSLTYGKGVQSLIAALPGIMARRPDAHLVVVGSGTYREVLEGLVHALATGNGALLDALVAHGRGLERGGRAGALDDLAAYAAHAAARRLLLGAGERLREHVHFLGRLDHSRLRLLLPAWRLAVFPSIVREASPLVFAESMAGGVLPVAADHSGLKDGLDDLAPHLPLALRPLVRIDPEPGRRVASLVEDVPALLDHLEREPLAARLRRVAVERYDWRSVAGSLVGAIDDFLALAPPVRPRSGTSG